MNRHERKLIEIIHSAAFDSGVSFRRVKDDVGALCAELHDDDDVADVATKAFSQLCLEDDGATYNRSSFGLKSVLRFLAEVVPEQSQPVDDSTLKALGALVKGKCTKAKFAAWVREWYG